MWWPKEAATHGNADVGGRRWRCGRLLVIGERVKRESDKEIEKRKGGRRRRRRKRFGSGSDWPEVVRWWTGQLGRWQLSLAGEREQERKRESGVEKERVRKRETVSEFERG